MHRYIHAKACSILSTDNHSAIAMDIAISCMYQQLYACTWTIYVLPGPSRTAYAQTI